VLRRRPLSGAVKSIARIEGPEHMNSTERNNPTTGLLVVAAIAVGGFAIAQGISKISPQVSSLVSPPPATVMQPGSSGATPEQQRIITWFSSYDDIRHQAQMTPEEKKAMHKLMSEGENADASQKSQARVILNRMIERYSTAIGRMQNLPAVPETAQLQTAYLNYFKTGRDFFSKYLSDINDGKSVSIEESLKEGRAKLGIMDVGQKMLDRKLRRQNKIQPYLW
jgi:hypothetical protein